MLFRSLQIYMPARPRHRLKTYARAQRPLFTCVYVSPPLARRRCCWNEWCCSRGWWVCRAAGDPWPLVRSLSMVLCEGWLIGRVLLNNKLRSGLVVENQSHTRAREGRAMFICIMFLRRFILGTKGTAVSSGLVRRAPGGRLQVIR